ncbi:MAG: N-acetylmuramoyl-L-alanine amidase [Lautropia sp.]
MPERDPAGVAGRRRLLKGLAAGTLAFDIPIAGASSVIAVRVWPSSEYTRVTLELDRPLGYSHFVIENPHRVVVDLLGVAVDSQLRALVEKVIPSDPYIGQVRVGQFKTDTMRLVFDVKQPVKPQVFSLDPVANYKYRLVVDLYPTRPPDPLDLLIAQTEAAQIMRELQLGGIEARARVGGDAGAQDDEGAPARADPPAQTTASRTAPASRVRGKARRLARTVTIAIDAGHGGEDPGAIGRRGTMEKDIVLSIAKRLQARIEADPDMRAYMTRRGDYFVPLATRVQKARAVKADLFVSIHADAAARRGARGSSVFVLSERGATSVEARWLARRENGADRIGGVNLKARNREAAQLLIEMLTRGQIRDSRRLGTAVLTELESLGSLHKPQVEQAGFAVLKSPDIPSILIETAFISNPDEERMLRDTKHQERIAAALMSGIRAYFVKHPPSPKGRVA